MIDDELDPNLELYPEWRQMLRAFLATGFTYGDTVEHDWFYTQLKLPTRAEQAKMPYEQVEKIKLKRMAQFEELQKVLLKEHQIDLQSVWGVGYVLVPPESQLERAFTEGLRVIRKTLVDIADRGDNTNIALLTAEQRREHADLRAQAAMLRRMLRPPRELPPADDE